MGSRGKPGVPTGLPTHREPLVCGHRIPAAWAGQWRALPTSEESGGGEQSHAGVPREGLLVAARSPGWPRGWPLGRQTRQALLPGLGATLGPHSPQAHGDPLPGLCRAVPPDAHGGPSQDLPLGRTDAAWAPNRARRQEQRRVPGASRPRRAWAVQFRDTLPGLRGRAVLDHGGERGRGGRPGKGTQTPKNRLRPGPRATARTRAIFWAREGDAPQSAPLALPAPQWASSSRVPGRERGRPLQVGRGCGSAWTRPPAGPVTALRSSGLSLPICTQQWLG